MRYDYECSEGHRFEIDQPMKDPSLKECVLCSASCRRVIYPPAISFRGSGWARDGYSSTGGKNSGGEIKD